jgi:hypothetical protein
VTTTKTLDDSTEAGNPGGIILSEERLRRLDPDLYRLRGLHRLTKRPNRHQTFWRTHVAEHLLYGCTQGAVVLSTAPLRIAALSDELDAAVVLDYPTWLVDEHSLEPGRQLLSVLTYSRGTEVVPDILIGPAPLAYRWINYSPLIAEFLTDDLSRVEEQHARLDQREWLRAEAFGLRYLEFNQGRTRDGRPSRAHMRATEI